MIKKTDYGYMAEGTETNLQIIFYSDKIVRFAYNPGTTLPGSTPAIATEAIGPVFKSENHAIITPDFKVEVDPVKLTVKISDLEGNTLSEDQSLSFDNTRVEKKKLWEKGIYGNGEKYTWLNQLGTKTVNYNSDILFHEKIHHPLVREMHTAIPFYIGAAPGRAYGIYFDNSYRTKFDFAKSKPEIISFEADGGILDYYFIYGPSIPEVVSAYGQLTGTPPMPRKKFLGYHQSRYSYKTREELLSVAANLRKHRIPCDVIYMDIHYMDAYKVFTVNSESFSDFKAMLQELKSMSFAVVVIINPGVKVENGYKIYEEGKEKGYFITMPSGEIYQGEVWPKPAAFPDFMRREVRDWWGTFHSELIECGIDAIWNDMNEPANFTLASGTLPEDALHKTDEGKEIPHAAVHNIYGLLQTKATRAALEKLQADKRAFVLSRAAFSGSQRYTALWTGDNASVWEHLEISIPMLLNLGMSGLSFVGADVGGYRGDCSGELLIRWTQLGAFYPYFRNHTEIATARQEPWEYPSEVLEIVRKYIRLRYSLTTYYYNLMRQSTLTGVPAIRPLIYHHGDDLNTYHIYDQLLLGEGLMVCPVCRPGMTHRMVYLPEGSWYDFWSGEKLEGGSYITVEAPLDRLPLYVKAGTILAIDQTENPDSIDDTGKSIQLRCYPGAEGRCRLYFDDGISNQYQEGAFSEIEISMSSDPVKPVVEKEVINEGYPLPEIEISIMPQRS